MTSIQALSPRGYTVTFTYEVDPKYLSTDWVLDMDKWLSENKFTPLPVPKSGGSGNWNKDGNTPRNWIEAEGNNLYVYFAYVESKEKSAEVRNSWLNKIKEATGVMGTAEHELFGKDAKGRDIWTYVYPIAKGREILEVLPADQFERKAKLQARLDAKKDK